MEYLSGLSSAAMLLLIDDLIIAQAEVLFLEAGPLRIQV